MSSALTKLLSTFREASKTEREKGTYFEELIRTYLQYEASYADLYQQVWLYSDWAKEHPEYGLSAKDTGIDLVAQTQGTEEFHAIQCKCYAEDYRIQKKDIDSFFTASGQKPFSQRFIVATTNNWSDNAEDAMRNQHIPVHKIDLHDLENSQIDWQQYQPNQQPTLKAKYDPRPHQETAINAVINGLKGAERGKLIMACGTGKTFTSLKLAERMLGKGKRVLFLVPSLSLLSQTLTEWTQQSKTPLHSFAVCSDSDVGKKRKKDDDVVQTFAHELRYPATTKAGSLAREVEKRHDNQHMSVVYSTYHSIEVISKAQQEHGLADFDLIICDEAHRTTGSTFADEEDSAFVKVHDKDYIRSAKRVYMTATPRIYGDAAKAKEDSGDVALFSMDDKQYYGEELHTITFSEAVSRGLLCDYKVIVLTVSADHVSHRLQSLLKDENNSLKVDDAGKIVGCWKALAKLGLDEDVEGDTNPMRRAVAFCQVIEAQKGGRTHKVSSKQISGMFQEVVESYQQAELEDGHDHGTLTCTARHIDGSMNATEKETQINWLKEEPEENTCKILSNVRCLSEGVDVPALDAVLFLTPRNSQVDVVQSVGRVMRNAPGKERGYVILPVVIPENTDPSEALNDNKTYKVVWEVLQALRSHDDRFDATINKLDLNGSMPNKMEVIAVTGDVQKKGDSSPKDKKKSTAKGQFGIGEKSGKYDAEGQMTEQGGLQFEVGEIEKALYAKIVKKCGNRNHWAEWANDIAKIAQTHITRIRAIVSDENNTKEVKAFTSFADELRDDLNDSISNEEVIEMLAQHLITKPVFDALFEEYSFASNNPVSQAMQHVLDVLQEHRLDKEADTLDRFYESVKFRAEGITTPEGKQKIVVELYDKFFRNAFPRMTERLGIVYTPIEVVDFIIHSVNNLLQQEFGQTLGSKGVHIIDPFTGTGTFITRLLQSGLISKQQLDYKYRNEIHCNEVILLAYYIAAINIEATYHALLSENKSDTKELNSYQPFEGICLTDTFQLYEKDDLISNLLANNSDRRNRQKNLDIRVILGNPPYSIGQKDEADNNKNITYPSLDNRIKDTYAKFSTATLQKGLYDSYIRAIRWATDRIGDKGVIGYISGSSFIDKPTTDGLRYSLSKEFTNIYVINLRGDIRKNMLSKGAAKEGGNIFGSGSMTGIAITFFVKNPSAKSHGNIFYLDIGKDLSTAEKLDNLSKLGDISKVDKWESITPNKENDWINKRDSSFNKHILIGKKRSDGEKLLFNNFSLGVVTNRDAWCYNTSTLRLCDNVITTVEHYKSESERYAKASTDDIDSFIDTNPKKISWTRSLKNQLKKGKQLNFDKNSIRTSVYRPFTKRWLYFDRQLNEMVYQIPALYPSENLKNLTIDISGAGSRSGFSALITNAIPNLDLIEKGQCFPLYIYEKAEDENNTFGDHGDLFHSKPDTSENGYIRKDGISDEGLAYVQKSYPQENVSKEDVFYYVYGLMHSEDYRRRYADNLSKELPRIPCVNTPKDFWSFSQAGRDLAELHINYENVGKFPITLDCGKRDYNTLTNEDFYVSKMKHPKVKNSEGKSVNDLSTVIYNQAITVRDIPLDAYNYIVNGKPAISWVIERQAVTTDKKSGIVNDANEWATETMNNPAYPLELLQRVITVSLETNKIVSNLPPLDID